MSSPPAEANPDSQSHSVFHRAANIAVSAIIAAFVVKFVSAQTPQPMGPWLSIGADLVGFLAVPAGVTALFGISKYGTKGLLWKGLAGVLIPTVLFLAGMAVAIMLRDTMQKGPGK